ncbi:ABC transporter permease [Mycolicibacterium agri]|nr:ABC transporter permease [Mycolicibacterium agri]
MSPWRIRSALLAVALGLFVGGPILALFYGAVRPSSIAAPPLEFSFEALAEVYLSSEVWRSLVGTMVIALAVALIATLVGGMFAWLTARTDVPGKGVIELLVLAPLFTSPFVAAIAWYALAAPRSGLINIALAKVFGANMPVINVTSAIGIVWVLALVSMPYAYVFISSSLRNMDPALEAASYVNGVGTLRTIRRVTLPLATPAIGSSIMFITIFAAGIFSVPGVLGRQLGFDPLPVLIYRAVTQFHADFAKAAALASLLFLLSAVMLYAYRRLTRLEQRFVTVSGKGFQPRLLPLGRLKPWVVGGVAAYAVVCVVLPVFALVIAALSPFASRDFTSLDLSTADFVAVLTDPAVHAAARNTVIAVVGAALACVVISLISVFIARIRGRGATSSLLDYVNTFPLAVPGIVLAAGLVWVYIGTPIYATLALMIIAYVISHLPHSYRLIHNGALQVSRELEEASAVNGYGRAATALRITTPLLMPSVYASVVLVTIFVIREVNSVILLYTPGTRVLSVLTWDYIADGNLSRAASLGLIQSVFLIAVLVVARLAFRLNLTSAYK